MLYLTTATLRHYRACDLDARIATYTAHHGRPPDDNATLRDWLDCTPNVHDWLWATRCFGREGLILALEVAARAARRAIALMSEDRRDPRSLRAVDVVDEVLVELYSGRAPNDALCAHVATAAREAILAEDGTANPAAPAAVYAAAAADTSRSSVSSAIDAANAATYAAAAAAAAGLTEAGERAAQKEDFLATLDRVEKAAGILPTPARPTADALATALDNLLYARELLRETRLSVPDYTGEWSPEDYTADAQEQYNRAADAFEAAVVASVRLKEST